MSNLSLFFRITSISVFSVDFLGGIYLLFVWILSLSAVTVMHMFHLVLFFVLLAINIAYVIYLLVVLIRDKKTR